MNFNLYLDREEADRLDRMAKKTRTPRNALIRKAVRAWLDTNAVTWPKEVMAFEADPCLVPFEAHRAELGPAPDPFEAGRRRK